MVKFTFYYLPVTCRTPNAKGAQLWEIIIFKVIL